MNDELNYKLSVVAIETLEQLAYIFFTRADIGKSPFFSESLSVSVSFSGPVSGQLTVDMTLPVLKELTANMLGIAEPHITNEQQQDALKETANILCGNFLPLISGSQTIFNVGQPSIIPENRLRKSGDEKPIAVVNLTVDDELCAISLFLDGGMQEENIMMD